MDTFSPHKFNLLMEANLAVPTWLAILQTSFKK
jgi:hypothetical protein